MASIMKWPHWLIAALVLCATALCVIGRINGKEWLGFVGSLFVGWMLPQPRIARAVLPMLALAFVGCDSRPASSSFEIGFRLNPHAATITPLAPSMGAQTYAVYTAASASCGGIPCIWADSALGKIKFRDATGTDKLTGEADRFTVAASDPGTPTAGQCIYNSTAGRVRCYQSGAWYSWGDGGTASAVFLAHADTAAATKYLGGPAYGAASATQITLFVAHASQSVRKIICSLGTAPGGILSDSFTVQTSTDHGATWSDSATTCTVTGTDQTCTGTTAAAVASGTRLAVKIVRNGLSSSADYNCEVVVS